MFTGKSILEEQLEKGIKIKEDRERADAKYDSAIKATKTKIRTLKYSLAQAEAELKGIHKGHKATIQKLKKTPGYQNDGKLRRMSRMLADTTKLMESLRNSAEKK